MPLEIHRKLLVKRYYVPYFSWSALYALICGFLLIFLPLIIAYNSTGFWINEITTYIQPTVQYRYESFIEFYGQRTDGTALDLYYSSVPQMNELNEERLRVPLLKSLEVDEDNDGKIDRLEFNIMLPLFSDEKITQMNFAIHSNVYLASSYVRYQWDDITLVQHSDSLGIKSVEIDGDLTVRQSWPFLSRGGYKTIRTGSLIDLSLPSTPSDATIANWIRASKSSNASLEFRSSYALSTPYTLPITQGMNATITMHIPVQPIRYSPTMSEVLKQAWIQYLAFFCVVWFLLQKVNDFVFSHKLLNAAAVNDVVREKLN